jgi:membrane associated rhomboid family serine protease
MLLPFKTDAPIYHWPFATVSLIGVNVLAAMWELSVFLHADDLSAIERVCLQLGDGLHPHQWVTSIFMHAGPMHLIGNMLFLWTFGLIVEGKVGWWQFLLCYFGVGVLQSAAEQVLFLAGPESISLGASAAIFGIMVIALIWAPVNEVSIFMILGFYPIVFDVKVVGLAGFFLFLNVFFAIMSQFSLSSELLHLMGAFLGFPIGLALLQLRLVDCEGYDLLSVMSNKAGKKITTRAQEREQQVAREEYQNEKQSALEAGQIQFAQYLKQGHLDMALARFRVMLNYDKTLRMSPQQLYEVIRQLHAAKRWRDSIPYMRQYIESQASHANLIQLKMAQLFLVEFERPRLTLQVLESCDPESTFSEQQQKLMRNLRARAQQMIREGHLEVDDAL